VKFVDTFTLSNVSEYPKMGDIYINQRLRQSPNGYIWKDPSNGSLAIENTEYRKVGSIDSFAGFRIDGTIR